MSKKLDRSSSESLENQSLLLNTWLCSWMLKALCWDCGCSSEWSRQDLTFIRIWFIKIDNTKCEQVQNDWCSNLFVCLFVLWGLVVGFCLFCFEEGIIIVPSEVMDSFKQEWWIMASLMTYDIVNQWKFNPKHADRKGTTTIGGWRLKEQGLLSLVVMLGS